MREAKKRSADDANLDPESGRSGRSIESRGGKARPGLALKKKHLRGAEGVATSASELPPTQALSPSASFIRPTRDAASEEQDSAEFASMNVDAAGITQHTKGDGSTVGSANRGHHGGDAVSAGNGDDGASSRGQELTRGLQEKLQEAEHRSGQLMKQLSDTEQELISLTDKLDKCHEHGKQLEDELRQKRTELEDRAKLIALLTDERLAMTTKLEEANKRAELQEAAIKAADEKTKSLSADLAKTKDALKSALAKNAALAAEVSSARSDGLVVHATHTDRANECDLGDCRCELRSTEWFRVRAKKLWVDAGLQ